jgi:hypothetical protein
MGSMIEVGGRTYPVREKLRDLGGKWDPEKKVAAAAWSAARAPAGRPEPPTKEAPH